MNVFIYGGCISRDMFEFDYDKQHNVVKYYARSLISSAFNKIKVDDIWSHNILSNFQRKMVEGDLKKTLSNEIINSEFDVLIIDFVSEQYPLFIFNDGSRCTLSSELLHAGFPQNDTSIGKKISPFSDEAFSLWEDGWQSFINLMTTLQKKHSVIINEIYWANIIDDGCEFEQKKYISMANSYFRRVYLRVLEDIPKEQFLSIPEKYVISSANHRWGKSPLHFINSYYQYKLNVVNSMKTVEGLTDC
jgi:hypothetical protein